MTTDRVDGFCMDRGVTLLGKKFKAMQKYGKRFGLGGVMKPVPFHFGLQERDRRYEFRAGRPDDLIFNRHFKNKSKLALVKLASDLFRHQRALLHGQTNLAASLDNENAEQYMRRIGCEEIFQRILKPALNAPTGGCLASTSRAVLMQTFWNLLVAGTWNIPEGVDRIPEAMAAHLRVLKHATVQHVHWGPGGVNVRASIEDHEVELEARGIIIAIPGHLVTRVCPDLPEAVSGFLDETQYAKMTGVHVALGVPPKSQCAGFGFSPDLADGILLELQHCRAPKRCPPGKGMISVYQWDHAGQQPSEEKDEIVEERALEIVQNTFPECRNQVLFTHLIRWQAGLARFPVGRIQKMIEVRKEMLRWNLPIQLCGDYLDGLSSEGALRTGEQAADQMASYLTRHVP